MPPLSEDAFTVNIDGLVEKELEFTIKELADTFPRKSVVAALQVSAPSSCLDTVPSPTGSSHLLSALETGETLCLR